LSSSLHCLRRRTNHTHEIGLRYYTVEGGVNHPGHFRRGRLGRADVVFDQARTAGKGSPRLACNAGPIKWAAPAR